MLAGPGRAVFGLFAIILPVAMILFGLVMAAVVGWRNWFGLPPKMRKDRDRRY